MPVTEAIAVGTPVLCSDLPALREAGGEVPEYIDPLDGPSWLAAIEALCSRDSAISLRQSAARLSRTPPLWADHMKVVLNLLDRVAA